MLREEPVLQLPCLVCLLHTDPELTSKYLGLSVLPQLLCRWNKTRALLYRRCMQCLEPLFLRFAYAYIDARQRASTQGSRLRR